MKATALSLFSGCGGFCEGAKLAGFDVVGAVEHDRFAVQTYAHNFPEVPLFADDVHAFMNPEDPRWTTEEAKRFDGVVPGELDLVFGGPPCQGFSQIGPRSLGDPRNQLYLEFLRVVRATRPRVVLMENVPNMLWLSRGVFKHEILKAFRRTGYGNVDVRVVAADDFGVPQNRERAIFFAVRDDLGGPSAGDLLDNVLASQRQAGMTVWDAIGDLPEKVAEGYETLSYPRTKRSNPIVNEMRLDRQGQWYTKHQKLSASGSLVLHNHHTKEIQDRRRNLISFLKPGLKADSLPKEIWDGRRPEKWRRFHPDRPAHTLLAQMHRDLSEWVHPTFDRWITVREAARLQSFHDGFVFRSSEWQMLKQIGNAVPPLLGRAVAMVAQEALSQANTARGSVTDFATAGEDRQAV